MSILCSLLIYLIFCSSFVDCISHDLDCLIYVFFCKDQWRIIRFTLSPIAVIRSLLLKHAHFTSRAIGISYSHPTRSPFPLASFTCGSSASFSFMYSPITFAFPLKSLSRISEMEARDAAHASGCPPYVEPCVPDVILQLLLRLRSMHRSAFRLP